MRARSVRAELLLAAAVRAPFWAFAARASVDGDTAIVGLMARHPTRGTTMWGQPYGSPVDGWIAAPFVAALGPSPLAVRIPYALLALALASSAQAVSTEATWSATSNGSVAGGSKAAPAAFAGNWNLTAVNNANPNYRPATPSSWAWSWEGVTVRQKGIPVCTPEQINDAKSVAGCPAG